MIWTLLVVAIGVGFIACGGCMAYSAISGKGITQPGSNALLQIKAQYKLRGIIGIAFILLGIMIIYGISLLSKIN